MSHNLKISASSRSWQVFHLDSTRLAMKTSIYLAISLFCLGTLLPAQDAPAAAQPWTAADYVRFTPVTFRAHPPVGQVMDWENPDYPLLSAAIFFASIKVGTSVA